MRALAVVLVVGLGAGCSWVFVERAPPPDKRGPYFYCHKSKAIPVADGFVAGLFGLNAIYALSKDEAQYAGTTSSQGVDIAFNLGVAALWAVSSGFGAAWVDECRAASAASQVGPPSAGPPNPVAAPAPIVAPVNPAPE
jgi:hypothetical protein